ncbi:SWI5-dependent HO expression protein 3 [Candida tropicalis]
MLSALLKRKERRILDLEDQYNDLNSQIENLSLSNKNMKIRCENLQNNSNASIAEFERLKISYDALIASQMEYKNHYQQELNTLQTNTKGQVEQNVDVIKILMEKYPDLQEKILEKEKVEVDLDEIISHSNEILANTSFEEDATLINSPDLDSQSNLNSGAATPVQNSGPFRKKKNYKRNSMILKDSPSGIPENSVPSSLPKKPQVNNNIINIPKNRSKFNTPPTTPRQFSNQSTDFEVTHQWNGNNNQHNNSGHYSNNNHRRTTSYDARSDNGGNRRQHSQGSNYNNNNNNNNNNNGFVRRSGSVRNGSNNNNNNNHGKQAKRRSTYNPNNNSKRNSQIFDSNFALNV